MKRWSPWRYDVDENGDDYEHAFATPAGDWAVLCGVLVAITIVWWFLR